MERQDDRIILDQEDFFDNVDLYDYNEEIYTERRSSMKQSQENEEDILGGR